MPTDPMPRGDAANAESPAFFARSLEGMAPGQVADLLTGNMIPEDIEAAIETQRQRDEQENDRCR